MLVCPYRQLGLGFWVGVPLLAACQAVQICFLHACMLFMIMLCLECASVRGGSSHTTILLQLLLSDAK